MIIGHVYYKPAPGKLQDQAFRDADILDFLGSMGIARIIATTEEAGKVDATLKPSMDVLHRFHDSMPAQLSLDASRTEAKPRLKQMERFFQEMNEQSYGAPF